MSRKPLTIAAAGVAAVAVALGGFAIGNSSSIGLATGSGQWFTRSRGG